MDVEAPTSVLSQSLLSSSLVTSMANLEPKKTAQYDALKMKYFMSLGMNRPGPQLSSSVPVHSHSFSTSTRDQNIHLPDLHQLDLNSEKPTRNRTKTAPSPKNEPEEIFHGDFRKRTTSVPIPIGMLTGGGGPTSSNVSVSLGTYLTSSFEDEDDDESEKSGLNTSSNSIHMRQESIDFDKDEDVDIFDDDDGLNYGVEKKSPSVKTSDSPVKFIPPHEMMAHAKKDFNVGTAHSVAVWEQRRRRFI